MSDRVKGFTVVLDANYKDEDAETIINAIGMIKGVQSVKSIVCDGDAITEMRIKQNIRERLLKILE